MVDEAIDRSYRAIELCDSRLKALHEQLAILSVELLPTARCNARLKAQHAEWPRPGLYEPLSVHISPAAGNLPPGDDEAEDDTNYIGEGIRHHKHNKTNYFCIIPCAMRLDVNGFYQVVPLTGGVAEGGDSDVGQAHGIDGEEGRGDSLLRLWAEIGRLKIARALKLRELAIVITNNSGSDDMEVLEGCRSAINDLNISLITASQAHLEAVINILPPEGRRAECKRIGGISDHAYAAEVFAIAGVAGWELTLGEEEDAGREYSRVQRRVQMKREAELLEASSMTMPDRMQSWMQLAHISEAETEIAVSLGQSAIVSHIVRMKRTLQSKEEALNNVRVKCGELSVAQKYIRRGKSKTRSRLWSEKLELSQEVAYLRSSISSLRTKLRDCDAAMSVDDR